jgi:hypothetical protein
MGTSAVHPFQNICRTKETLKKVGTSVGAGLVTFLLIFLVVLLIEKM